MTIRIDLCYADYQKLKYERNKEPTATYIVVTRDHNHTLSPSWDLLKSYKRGDISISTFKLMFVMELENNPLAKTTMRSILNKSKEMDVYLICYEKDPAQCHRSVLKELIENMDHHIN